MGQTCPASKYTHPKSRRYSYLCQTTGFGVNTLTSGTGLANTAFGNQSLNILTNGAFNSAYGNFALYFCTIGQGNVAIGFRAQRSNQNGNNNVSIGNQSLENLTTAASSNNIALGGQAGLNLNGGNYNLFIGNHAPAGTYSNRFFIHYSFSLQNTKIISVSPNPSSNQIVVSLNIERAVTNAKLQIHDLDGNVAGSFNISERENNISKTLLKDNYGKGIYIVSLVVNGKSIDTKKIVFN